MYYSWVKHVPLNLLYFVKEIFYVYKEIRFRISEDEYKKINQFKVENYDSFRKMIIDLIETQQILMITSENQILQVNLENYLNTELDKINENFTELERLKKDIGDIKLQMNDISKIKEKLNEIIMVLNNNKE